MVDSKVGNQRIAEDGFDGLDAEIGVDSNVGVEGCITIGLKMQAEGGTKVRLSI